MGPIIPLDSTSRLSPRAPFGLPPEGVSRFGEIPKPTVTVRMEENGVAKPRARAGDVAASYALILVSDARGENHESELS